MHIQDPFVYHPTHVSLFTGNRKGAFGAQRPLAFLNLFVVLNQGDIGGSSIVCNVFFGTALKVFTELSTNDIFV